MKCFAADFPKLCGKSVKTWIVAGSALCHKFHGFLETPES